MKFSTRYLALAVISLLLVGCSYYSSRPAPPIVEQRYVPQEDFSRISEYFTGQENPGNRIYLRSDSNHREGYYWIVPREKIPKEPAQVILLVQIPGSPENLSFDFPLEDSHANESVFWIGLTGPDWPGPRFKPVAWRLSFLSHEGEELFSGESFLWTAEQFPETGN